MIVLALVAGVHHRGLFRGQQSVFVLSLMQG